MPAAEARLGCDEPIRSATTPQPQMRRFLNAIAMVPSTMQADHTGIEEAPHQLFIKSALSIRAGQPATLAVPAGWIQHVAVEWGTSTRRWTTKLTIPACPPAAGGPRGSALPSLTEMLRRQSARGIATRIAAACAVAHQQVRRPSVRPVSRRNPIGQ